MTASERATLAAAVRWGGARLAEAGVGSPDSDAVSLAAHTLGCSGAEVRRRMIIEDTLAHEDLAAFESLIEARCGRTPLQHLTGTAAFRRLSLNVGPGVFLPRPETEVVAQAVIDEIAGWATGEPLVVDLCSGSAAIALSVKDESAHARVIAVEVDPLAQAWARANRDGSGLDVELVDGDARTALPDLEGAVDVVVSNPPYIPTGMVPVDPEVRDHDPPVALYGGSADGLRIPLAVADRAAVLLRPGGLLVMEHADTHGETLPAALRRRGVWMDVHDHLDLAGRARFVTARRT